MGLKKTDVLKARAAFGNVVKPRLGKTADSAEQSVRKGKKVRQSSKHGERGLESRAARSTRYKDTLSSKGGKRHRADYLAVHNGKERDDAKTRREGELTGRIQPRSLVG